MRKSYAAVDARTNDNLELTRRWHKTITDIVKRLDENKNHAAKITDLLTPLSEALRVRLKDYCERLIFKDVVANSRKIEELLWRKGYYEVVSTAKKLRKGNEWNEVDKAFLSIHLSAGIGYYHHLILKLQSEFSMDLIGLIDFPYTQNETQLINMKKQIGQLKQFTDEVKQHATRLIHRSLVCLGDLARYQLDLNPKWDPMTANRYYKMAISINPNIGMPHNQLGTIAGNKNYGLDAVYHYMRCILCSESFEGAESNLKRAIATHSTCSDENSSTYHCISRLLVLLHLWDYENPNSDRINQECQEFLNDIENCLIMSSSETNNIIDIENEDNIEKYLQKINEQGNILTTDMIFKIVAICLMSISRLKNKESSEVQGVIAITLAILSQLIQFTVTKLQETIVDLTLPIAEDITETNTCSNNKQETKVHEIQNGKHKIIKNTKLNADQNLPITKINNKNESVNNQHSYVNIDNNSNNSIQKSNKQKSLLTKLRRRKRRNSSDSDASDIDEIETASSSDEMNSGISETEEDALSERIELSDDALSDDLTDDEAIGEKVETNGIDHIDSEKNETLHSSNLKNDDVDQHLNNDQIDLKSENKNSNVINATTNVEPTSNYNENSASTHTVAYVTQLKNENLTAVQVLDILNERKILSSVKICCDWLKSNQEIIKMCAKSSKLLMKRLITLLNLIHVDTNSLKEVWKTESLSILKDGNITELAKIVPLPEDIDLRGLSLFEDAHKNIDWKILHKRKINEREETLLRIIKLTEFGYHLSSTEDSGITYDEDKNVFTITEVQNQSVSKTETIRDEDLNADHPRGKLMRHMGRLWLKAEVRALESRLRSKLMSPYIVPDHEALTNYTPALKRLVYTKKFIVVIPAVVVSALDEVKRTSSRAREATRWLEAQFRRGSRFLRAQRPHERLALPLIKGPRPKDKEAWLFFQIIECCHYLTQQTKVGLTNDVEAPVVTLLTGCSLEDKKSLTYSPEGLTKSAGVNFEHIESFNTKWKATSKSHG